MKIIQKFSPFYSLGLVYLVCSFLLRLVLIFHPITQSNFGVFDVLKIFGIGLVSDFFVYVVFASFLWFYLITLSNSKFNKPYGYIIFGILLTLLGYISFFNTKLNEYGGVLPEIGITFVSLKTVLFGLLLFLPKYRFQIRKVLYIIAIFIFVLILLQNTVSEFFFWNEFGVKYNFIAVNYLVYTNEVIGNIMQSYPVIPLFSILFLVTATVTFLVFKKTESYLKSIPSFTEKIVFSISFWALFAVSLLAIPQIAKSENSKNVFVNELQSNGMYKFYLAFVNSELDYFKFYKTMPMDQAYQLLSNQLKLENTNSSLQKIDGQASEIHKNVVLITIESYSAEFMKMYGNEQNITPFLDKLATESLVFTNLYAVGNRTVRGLEAVTLSLPPTAGESVVKRKDNKNKFSTGSVFAQKNYQVKYLYGGDSYFDNMRDFFSGNNYEIEDKTTMSPNEITFSNVWGVCDEDMANRAIKIMNQEHKSGKPFFNHWMTVSNHRPFTYPTGKIDIPADSKSREGGVKYTDYALQKFFEMAKKQPWFSNTVFVIVADHCASSAGKTELPMDKYRIPAMIYSPGFVKPQYFDTLMSQIDVMPTLFGLLNFDYQSKFYGQDVFQKDYKPRAFIATYQDLGLIKDDVLTIISPKQTVKQFKLKLKKEKNVEDRFQIFYEEELLSKPIDSLVNQTISYYQTASEILKNKKYNK